MPHIIIKTIGGKSKEQMQEVAEKVGAVVSETLGKPMKYVSVSVEDYSFDEWESVYNECIKDNANVLVKPGYSNPRTFE